MVKTASLKLYSTSLALLIFPTLIISYPFIGFAPYIVLYISLFYHWFALK